MPNIFEPLYVLHHYYMSSIFLNALHVINSFIFHNNPSRGIILLFVYSYFLDKVAQAQCLNFLSKIVKLKGRRL